MSEKVFYFQKKIARCITDLRIQQQNIVIHVLDFLSLSFLIILLGICFGKLYFQYYSEKVPKPEIRRTYKRNSRYTSKTL